MTSTDVQPFTPKPFFNRTKIYVHIKLGRGVALTCTISKTDAEFMRQILFVALSLNHTNCLQQETVRQTSGNVIGGIGLRANPPPFIAVLSSGPTVCMGNAQATMS